MSNPTDKDLEDVSMGFAVHFPADGISYFACHEHRQVRAFIHTMVMDPASRSAGVKWEPCCGGMHEVDAEEAQQRTAEWSPKFLPPALF